MNYPIVIAYVNKPEKTKRIFSFNLGEVVIDGIIGFLKKAFTKEKTIEKATYSEIYTITNKGVEKIEELPSRIALFISTTKQ